MDVLIKYQNRSNSHTERISTSIVYKNITSVSPSRYG